MNRKKLVRRTALATKITDRWARTRPPVAPYRVTFADGGKVWRLAQTREEARRLKQQWMTDSGLAVGTLVIQRRDAYGQYERIR